MPKRKLASERVGWGNRNIFWVDIANSVDRSGLVAPLRNTVTTLEVVPVVAGHV